MFLLIYSTCYYDDRWFQSCFDIIIVLPHRFYFNIPQAPLVLGFHALIVLGKNDCPYWLYSCMTNLSKFHIVFSSSALIRLNKVAFEVSNLASPQSVTATGLDQLDYRHE